MGKPFRRSYDAHASTNEGWSFLGISPWSIIIIPSAQKRCPLFHLGILRHFAYDAMFHYSLASLEYEANII